MIAHVTGLLTGLPAGTGHRLPACPAALAGPAGAAGPANPANPANPAGREPVFVIDREADSVGHYRRWDRAGRRFVVRADDKRLVLHEGTQRTLPAVVALLKRRRAFAEARRVEFKGRSAVQFVAETTVVLHRPARQHRVDRKTGKRKRRDVPGKPLPLRLIVSEVRDDGGKVLARWLLLTNLPASAAPAATVALWYYWRWRIEGYHKLLKGAGQEVECWQQEHAEPLSRRLLVAAMSAVIVWKLARDDRPEAAQMRDVLMRLSGRQVKRRPAPDGSPARGFTEPALLAGLGVLIPMLHLLATHDLDDLRRMAHAAFPGLFPNAIPARRDTG